jgi:hypothetical protein
MNRSAMEHVSGFERKNLLHVMLNMLLISFCDFQYFMTNRDPHFENIKF